MGQLWFNTLGILHDGVGLVLCDYCPCDPPPSDSGSSSVIDSSSVGSGGCTDSTCVEVSCCPGKLIPQVLTLTITGGSCPQTTTATWDGTAWRGDTTTLTIDLSCDGTPGTWRITVDFDAQEPTVICDPFSATFDFFGTMCGDITVTFTE